MRCGSVWDFFRFSSGQKILGYLNFLVFGYSLSTMCYIDNVNYSCTPFLYVPIRLRMEIKS